MNYSRLCGCEVFQNLAIAALLTLWPTRSAWAVDQTKANNNDALNLASSWVGNAVPGQTDRAIWDGTLSAANCTNNLGATMNWGQIQIKSPSAGVPVNIQGSDWVRLFSGVGIDMSAATVDLNCGFNVQAWVSQSFNVQAGRTLTISGALWLGNGGISLTLDGSGNYLIPAQINQAATVIKQGSGTLTLGHANYFTNFILSAGTANLNQAYAINGSANSTMVINGGTIGNTSGGAITFSFNPPAYTWNGDFAFTGPNDLNVGSGSITLGGNVQVTASTGTLMVGGAIGDGGHAYSLTKAGTGTLTLAGANAYTGSTLINAGKLALSSGGSISNSPLINIAGGATFDVSGRTAAATLRSGQTLQVGGSTNSATLATTTGKGLALASTSPLQFTAFKPAGSGGAVPLAMSGAGTLTLGASTPVTITVANGGTALTAAGSPYKLIAKGASGAVTTLPGGILTVNGDGFNGTPSLTISNSELYLLITGSSVFTTTTLALASGKPIYGNIKGLTFTATVKTNGITAGNATSNFVFSVDGLLVATNTVSGGSATYTTPSNLTVGSHLITAKYRGDANYKPSTNTLTQPVNPLPVGLTGTRAYDGTTNAAYGILTITNILGSDSVFLVSGSAGLAGANIGTQAIVSPNTLTLGGAQAGNYTVTGLTGSVLITKTSSSLLLASSVQPSGWQQPVTFNASVQNNGITARDATGSVAFKTNGVALGSGTLINGVAYSLTVAKLAVGTNLITAEFAGDSNYLGSTNTLSQIILPPQTNDVTFSNSLVSLTIDTNGTVTSVIRSDTGAQMNNNSKGWYVYRGQDKTSIPLNRMAALNASQLMLWSGDGRYGVIVAVTNNSRYLKVALVNVSNNPQTGRLDGNWPGYSVAFSVTTSSSGDGWTLNTVPLDYMVDLNVFAGHTSSQTSNPLVFWPYAQYSQTNASVYPNGQTTNNPQPMGAAAIFPSKNSAQYDDILLDIWVGEPSTPRPNRANQTSWTRTDAAAWLDRYERDLPPSRAVMFSPNNLSELYQVADIMFTNNLNSLYLFHSYWQGSNPAIDGINPTLFPNGSADLTALNQYCAQRGISLWFHGNSGYVNPRDPLYGEMSPTGLSPDLARCATGTLLTDFTGTSTSFHVQPDPGCQPFTAPPPWGDYSSLYPPYYPGDFSSYISISNDLYSAYSVQVISPTDWLVTNLTRKVVNTQWAQNHQAGSRADFLPNYGGGAFIPDSRSPLLATQARTFAALLNREQIPYANYDGQDINEDLGYWGPRRFSQCLYESLDHPVHASQAAMTAPFGHFEYLFNRIQKHEGGKGFVLEISQIGGLAPLRLWDPSFMATQLDEDQWAFGCAAGYAPNFMIFGYHIGTDLNTIKNHGQWSQVVSNLNLWQAVAPYLSTSQMAILRAFATDFYVPSQTSNQWQITPTRAMLRDGMDSPWQLMVERGPISPHQFNKANGTTLSPLNNPYPAQTPQIEFLVLPGMSATNANNVSLMTTSPLFFTSANTGYNWSYSALGHGSTLNMSGSRGIAVTLTGDNSGAVLVFNIGNRDYAVTVNFSGQQTIEIPNGEVVWYRSNTGYGLSKSGTTDTFDYASVSTFKLFLGYVPAGVTPNIQVNAIKTMQEDQTTGLVNPVLTLNGNSARVVGTIPYNNYLTFSGGASAQVYDANWNYKNSLAVTGAILSAVNGANTFSVAATNSPNAWMATRVKVSGLPWVIGKPAPIHEWRFENSTADEAGTANGTAINAPVHVPGIEGASALSFDGVNQYVSVTNLADFQFTNTQSFTLSAWVKLNSLPNAAASIVKKDSAAGPWYGLGITAANQWVFGGATDIVSPATTDAGLWHLIVGVQDGSVGTRKLYVDGLLMTSGAAQDGSGPRTLAIGAAPGTAPSQFLNGSVDDVRVYNQALAQADISLMATNLASAANGILTCSAGGGQLVLNWPAGQLWRLQAQTNNLGLTSNWVSVTGATPPYTTSINPSNPAVFYRLTRP